MPDRIDELDRLLRSVNASIVDVVRHAVQPHGFPHHAMRMLGAIRQEPGITISEIARRTGVAKSNISNMVDRLAEAGFLEKRSDPADQRLARIYVTPQADRHFAQVRDAVRRHFGATLAMLGPGQIEALLEGLTALEQALAAARDARLPEDDGR